MSGLSLRAYKAQRALKTQSPTNLFESPTNIIKPWRAGVAGAKEWQTSTYSYNKQTPKTLPAATAVTEKLLHNYLTIIRGRGTGSSGASSVARNAVAIRRKSQDRVFISEPSVKDHGNKLVLNAFVYGAAEAAEEERQLESQRYAAASKNQNAPSGDSRPGDRSPSDKPARRGPPGPRGPRQSGGPRASGPRPGGSGPSGPRSSGPRTTGPGR